jgi:hypothetical protein
VIGDRSQVRSRVVVSQLPVENWHTGLAAGDPTLTVAIVTDSSIMPTAWR